MLKFFIIIVMDLRLFYIKFTTKINVLLDEIQKDITYFRETNA